MLDPQFLTENYDRGFKVSANGVLGRIRDGQRPNKSQRWEAGEMLKLLHVMSDRFYSGDIKAVDEFLQLYCLDEKRESV